eukprot:3418267-Rhodomonas_salina.1
MLSQYRTLHALTCVRSVLQLRYAMSGTHIRYRDTRLLSLTCCLRLAFSFSSGAMRPAIALRARYAVS